MKNGKRYLVIIEQEKNVYVTKLAYWIEERETKYHTYKTGFYHSHSYYYPYKNVIRYIDIPGFTAWGRERPIEGEKYLVYRVGSTSFYQPHYSIRKYHRGSFGSKDIKYWISLNKAIGQFGA